MFDSRVDFAETQAVKENKPIVMSAWHMSAFVLMLVHVYSGWLAGTPLPKLANKGVLCKFKCAPADLEYADWRNLYELARMLELHRLAIAASAQLEAILVSERKGIERMLIQAEAAENDDEDDEDEDKAKSEDKHQVVSSGPSGSILLKVGVQFMNGEPTKPELPCLVPSYLDLLKTLDRVPLCDCSFLPSDAKEPIYASKALLARASLFFMALFDSKGDFADTKAAKESKPIDLPTWRNSAFMLVLVHTYSGWVPGTPIPKLAEEGVMIKFKCLPADLDYSDWRNLYELARMTEMHHLAIVASEQLEKILLSERKGIKRTLSRADDGDENEQ
ncbi:hypothetical protein BC828DRAFT_396956 [Blastocladiella britannica]|nr:hypothetical protein BC828DRAFT_396956 [Blastocladiella britannica]